MSSDLLPALSLTNLLPLKTMETIRTSLKKTPTMSMNLWNNSLIPWLKGSILTSVYSSCWPCTALQRLLVVSLTSSIYPLDFSLIFLLITITTSIIKFFYYYFLFYYLFIIILSILSPFIPLISTTLCLLIPVHLKNWLIPLLTF